MGKQKDNLEKQFEKAGLACKVLKDPIRAINAEIFQADIQRGFAGNKRKEYFRIYKGHEDNLVTVANVDKEINQLVLVVKETERNFEQKNLLDRAHCKEALLVPKEDRLAWANRIHQGSGRRGKVTKVSVTPKSGSYWFEQKTPGSVRHYLLGVDERQLFIAELPKAVTSVAEAHRSLKSNTVTFAEGRAGGKTLRQGEWFFVEATEEEKESISRAIKNNKLSVVSKGNIGRLTGARPGGKAHIAQEAVVVGGGPRLAHDFSVRERPEVFVRGNISHPDHATVHLHQWRRVLKNAEKENDSNRSASGVYWID